VAETLHKFFLIIPPGLESLARVELGHWLPDLKPLVDNGGLQIEVPLAEGFALNAVLKIPTRILLRLDEFRCRDFPTLFKRIQKLPWRDFVSAGPVEWEVSASASRLGHERRITETCTDAYAAFHRAHEPKQSSSIHGLRVFVRIVSDACVISIDTSGEALYRRGYRTHIGEAPLRENLAAALLWALGSSTNNKVTLVDPMMGSGTFLCEAYHLLHINRFRSYAYQNFVCCPNEARDFNWVGTRFNENNIFHHLSGSDIDTRAVEAATHNAKLAQLPTAIATFQIADIWSKPNIKTAPPTWLICNPPYGERLATDNLPVADYLKKLVKTLIENFKPQKIGLLISKGEISPKELLTKKWEISPVISFRNGGIPVQFIIGTLREQRD
jgi:putative N6-adenine-specific DNA methylase